MDRWMDGQEADERMDGPRSQDDKRKTPDRHWKVGEWDDVRTEEIYEQKEKKIPNRKVFLLLSLPYDRFSPLSLARRRGEEEAVWCVLSGFFMPSF